MPTQPSGEMRKSWRERHRLRGLEGGSGPGGQQDRQEGDRDQHRHDDEGDVARGVGEGQDELRRDDPDHLHDHVERQRLAAGLVGRRVVQPALGDDIDPGEGEADDEAHQRPDPGRRRRGIEDERRRDHRGERCEHPHVPDAGDHRRGALRAEQEAEVVAAHHEGHRLGVVALDRAADAEQRALQAVADEQQQHAEQQRPGGGQDVEHGAWDRFGVSDGPGVYSRPLAIKPGGLR